MLKNSICRSAESVNWLQNTFYTRIHQFSPAKNGRADHRSGLEFKKFLGTYIWGPMKMFQRNRFYFCYYLSFCCSCWANSVMHSWTSNMCTMSHTFECLVISPSDWYTHFHSSLAVHFVIVIVAVCDKRKFFKDEDDNVVDDSHSARKNIFHYCILFFIRFLLISPTQFTRKHPYFLFSTFNHTRHCGNAVRHHAVMRKGTTSIFLFGHSNYSTWTSTLRRNLCTPSPFAL